MTIKELRKIFPKSAMGNREKAIINSPTARVTKARSFSGCLKVSTKTNYFVFTYKKHGYKDFTVVN